MDREVVEDKIKRQIVGFDDNIMMVNVYFKKDGIGTLHNKDWIQLFNGKDLTGWKQDGPGGHSVEDGLIASHGGMGLLYWTKQKFGNCSIKVVYKMQNFMRLGRQPPKAFAAFIE